MISGGSHPIDQQEIGVAKAAVRQQQIAVIQSANELIVDIYYALTVARCQEFARMLRTGREQQS